MWKACPVFPAICMWKCSSMQTCECNNPQMTLIFFFSCFCSWLCSLEHMVSYLKLNSVKSFWLKHQRPVSLSSLKLSDCACDFQTLSAAESNRKAISIGREAHQERPWKVLANCLPATNTRADKTTEWEQQIESRNFSLKKLFVAKEVEQRNSILFIIQRPKVLENILLTLF